MISSLVNKEMEMMHQEAVVACFYLLAQNLPGWP